MKYWLLLLSLIFVFEGNAQKMEPLGAAINTEFNELHPLIAADGQTLYFERVNHPSNNFGKDGSTDVWFADLLPDGRWALARKMHNNINKGKFNDLFSITPDGNTALIRGVYENGRKLDENGISVVVKRSNNWDQPKRLNIPKLSSMIKGQFLSAYLGNNGKILLLAFSEKRDSKNDDIYVSLLDKKGNWSEPLGLGNVINTDDSETTPFLASDNNTLYFASNRKDGLGGFDIWMSKKQGRSWDSWTKPKNLGAPTNTDGDEFYYSLAASGDYAYLCTKKNTVGKGDIVKIKLILPEEKKPEEAALQASVNDKTTGKKVEETQPNTVVLLSGIVRDQRTGKPAEAKIVYEDLDKGDEIGIAYSNPTTGEYKIVLPYGTRYAIRAEAKDFISVSRNIDLTRIDKYKEIKGEDLGIAPIQAGMTVLMNNIFFEFGKAELQPESFLELDRMAELFAANPNLQIEVKGHTDNVGSDEANLKLSQLRADEVRNYFLSKKVAPDKVKSVGYGESQPITTNETTEGQAKNRRVEFEIIRK